jgi:serpin B
VAVATMQPHECWFLVFMLKVILLDYGSAFQLHNPLPQHAMNFIELEDQVYTRFKPIVEPLNCFSLSLMFKHSFSNTEHMNSAVSSLSVETMLYHLLRAADGSTSNQITYSLGLDPGNAKNVQELFFDLMDNNFDDRGNLASATYLLLKQLKTDKESKELKKFQRDIQRLQVTGMETVDKFADPKLPHRVNDWFKKHTHFHLFWMLTGKLPADQSLVVLNAVYHKIKWQYPFNLNMTEKGTFYNGKNTDGIKNIDFMVMKKARLAYADFRIGDTYAEVLDLPLTSKRLSMILFLPYSMQMFKKAASVRGSEDQKKVIEIMHRIQNYVPNGNVDIKLPKFAVNNTVDVYTGLKEFGIVDIFNQRKADLGGIRGHKEDYVSFMKHRTFVRLEEFGSNGDFANDPSKADDKQYTFEAIRPFAFFVMDRTTGLILLNGIIEVPDTHAEHHHII